MENRFLLSSTDCELLLKFEQHGSLQSLANAMGKDISVISRNLKALAERSHVIEKRNGRWKITPFGESLNQWSKEAIYSQKLALNKQKSLKIGATREFANRILLPHLKSFVDGDDMSVSIVASDKGIESLILSGEVDLGFDCGRPVDPLIKFKQGLNEPFCVVASPEFIKKNKIKNFDDLKKTSLLKFTRTENMILNLDVEASIYYGTFNDVANLRQACVLGYGWAILPKYCVSTELKNKELNSIGGIELKDANYGVWWLRERKSLEPWAKKAFNWLTKQSLD